MRHLIIIPLFIFALASCTEVMEVEKLVHDTITVPGPTSFLDRYIVDTDTVLMPIAGPHTTDTVYMPVVRYEYETVYDTVVQREIIYGDTLLLYAIRTLMTLPPELMPYVKEFSDRARAHGKTYQTTGKILFEYWEPDPADWSSFSFTVYTQYVLRVREDLTYDAMLTPVWRELARAWLGKKYTSDGGVMDPEFDPRSIRWSNRAQYEAELNKVFE